MATLQLNRIGESKDNKTATVIFLHGLGGNATDTWTHGPSKGFWPAWLVQDIAGLGVYTLDYDSAPSAWMGNSMALPERAQSILSLLVGKRLEQTPLIFICHSLGGLVVKQMLRLSSDQQGTHEGKIAENTRGVIFLGTPHVGSSLAVWADRFRLFFRKTPAIDDLQLDSPWLLDLNVWYRNHAPKHAIQTLVFVENQPTKGVPVVDKFSGDPGIQNVYPIALDADHIEMCKPEKPTNPMYERVVRFLEDLFLVFPSSGRNSNLLPLLTVRPPGDALPSEDLAYIRREAEK